MRFTTPLALIFLLALPLVALIGWPQRGWDRRRQILSLVLRLTMTTFLVLSLAGLELTVKSGKGSALGVVFLVDVSDSMPAAARQAEVDYVQQALKAMGPDDEAAVILFGGEALVERPMSSSRQLSTFTSIPSNDQTDLEKAIQLAMALYPPEKARRMVILSDGVATVGNAQSAAGLAGQEGVDVLVRPLIPPTSPEAMVTSVDVPGSLRQGDRFNLNVSIESSQPTRAVIRVLSDGRVVFDGTYDLKRGDQVFSLPLTASQPGFQQFQVQIDPEQDTFYQNNELSAYTQVSGPPRVLLVAPKAGEPLNGRGDVRPDEAAALLAALRAAGFTVDQKLPYDLPGELPDLAQYTSIVMVDTPARQLTDGQMLAVQAYVRDLGGGLLVVGGPTSYGVGGYFRTPLENVLPVEVQIKDEKRRPSLAIVFIIDHSGSMSETSGGVTKLELAKEAAMRSIELLMPGDRVGVVTFDDTASWVVPMTDLSDPAAVVRQIGTLRPGGGTDILAGLQAMAAVLPKETASTKHVILLTDGGANPAGIPELVARLNQQDGITLTTVGVGRDAAPFLPQIAELGGGRYHFAENSASIPSIFTEETSLATRAYLVEEPFQPKLQGSSPILSGIEAMPPLYGYVGTSPKDSAQTILVTHKGDPLLASWRYGLGKVVSFTSDATGRWAKDWLAWDQFPTFWAQALRYTLGEPVASTLNVQVRMSGGTASLAVDANAQPAGEGSGAFLDGYTVQANIIPPQGEPITATLGQTAPGKYVGSFTPHGQGVYLIKINGQDSTGGDRPPLNETSGWALSYSPEYRQLQPDPDALYRIALAAGGQVAPSEPAGAFKHTLEAPGSRRQTWPWLLALAACFLPIDIAVRRLVFTYSDVKKGLAALRGLLGRKPVPAAPLPRSARVEGLLRAKGRVNPERKPQETAPPAPVLPKPVQTLGMPPKPEAEPPPPLPAQIERAQGNRPATGQTTAAALLARKKARKDR